MISDFEEAGDINQDQKIIHHSDATDLLGLTMLVYDYSKKFKLKNDETIENFVQNLKGGAEELGLSDERQKALGELSEKSPHGRVVDFISDEETDIQVAVTLSEVNKRICVVFRGSESSSDWYYDLMITKHNLHDDVWVHKGFFQQLTKNGTYDKLLESIKKLADINPTYKIYVTGHSLGAALSTLFGYMLSREISDKEVIVVSFASPRVGDGNWKNAFDSRSNLVHYRVTNSRDVITAVPMIFYKHVGINISLEDDKYEIFSKGCEYPWYRYSLFTCWSVGDHDCDLYYKRLVKHNWDSFFKNI